MKLINAPIGLLMFDDTLFLKTEYCETKRDEKGYTVTVPMCYILSSGEYFWGGAETYEERNNLEVKVVKVKDIVKNKGYVCKAMYTVDK